VPAVSMRFPEGFLWGAATSAQQIEGAVDADGRGESIWDRFETRPGAIEDGSSSRVACDHYRLWREDLDRLRWLGVGAYRFSIAWPRVFPEGRGPVNEAGLDFYDALVDGLLESGIQPFVTLYHWDLPQPLQDRGGWGTRDTAFIFSDYAEAVAARLGDRVKRWVTHNEPWCIATLGHEEGHHAPGHRDPAEALRVAHHVLLSHGLAMEAVKRHAPESEAGLVLNLTPAVPATSSEGDRAAASWFDGFFNRWYLDPVFRGSYPADAVRDRVGRGHLPGEALPFVHPGDMEVISRPLDFLGVNYYSRVVMREGENGVPEAVNGRSPSELTDMGWEVYPEGLYELLRRLHREYPCPAYHITENGAAYGDEPDADGRIADRRRIEYLHRHLLSVGRAVEDGVPVRGYFVWSLLDNFEWGHGYAKRFGLFWVDYATQSRLPKDSAHWYRGVIGENAVEGVLPAS